MFRIITLTSNALATTVFSPTFFTNGYNVNCIGDCNGQIFVNFINPTELYTIDWYLDSVFGSPFYSSTTLNTNSSSQSNLCAGDMFFCSPLSLAVKQLEIIPLDSQIV